ncbi:MAG: YARHG domain-containing protein [Lewinella sp.]|uniref:YARHG domain-containing protein n=1 Tax=Lewinella sp. TaxID=2004506 RepID=UPI003D6BE2D9
MTLRILFALLCLALLSCGGPSNPPADTTATAPQTESAAPEATRPAKERPSNSASAHFASNVQAIGPAMTANQELMQKDLQQLGQAITNNEFLGYYTGTFGPNQITLILAEQQGQELRGYSVCAGNYRPLTGRITEQKSGEYYVCELAEPGNDPYDGTFTFTIYPAKQQLQGEWKPFRAKGNTARTYTLTTKNFRYQPTVGEWPEASQRLLTEEDVWNYNSDELRLMRNEIYARHGYSFKIKDMRYYFEEQDWYMPVTTDIRRELTTTEIANIELIYEYETYYDEYYDEFGR